MAVRSQIVGSRSASSSTALSARLSARGGDRRRRNRRVWALRLLAGTGALWLLLIVVGFVAQAS
jgi:hypothetical protein